MWIRPSAQRGSASASHAWLRRATDASRLWVQTHLHSPSSGQSSEPDSEQPLPAAAASNPHVFELKDGHFDAEGGRRSLPDDPEAESPLSEWLHPWPRPPVGADEDDRLRALHALSVLDSSPEKPFDMICDLAKARLACPMAAVSFLDEHRQWFKASVGLAHKVIPRKIAFCAYTVFLREPMVVLDTLQDPRFERNPLVSGAAGVRFYAAAPIVDPTSGHVVGSVFVLDTQPRESCDIAILERLAYAAGENLPQRMEISAIGHEEAAINAVDLELERQQGNEHQQFERPEGRQVDSQHEAQSFNRSDLKVPTSPALSSSTASLSSVASGCYSDPASSPSKAKSPRNSSDNDASSTAMTSLSMGKTASGEQMEVLLMRLLTQNTETQQQLAVQQISLSTKLGQHTDQINKLMSDFARMEAKVDAKVDSKAR
ncbi:hypothetical protein BBJ28_00017895 [Nothophytophthora sp. Chile5]|nr:hypothetical protein BBJ28_00017895 [Nothophytophthora sp. Chile5]